MPDNVVYAPFKRHRLGNLALRIEQMIYDEAANMSLCEALGVLDIVKSKIINNEGDD
jgi:hypothetical protein